MRNPMRGTGSAGAPRTKLKTVRHLGSARSGTEHFIQQRLTAFANFVLVLVLAVVAIALSGREYQSAVALVGSPWVAVPLALAMISVAIHLKLGLQVVIEDYIHAEGLRIGLTALTTFFAAAVAGLALFAIVRIVFTATALSV